jgi:hypothetical protein
VPPSRQKAALLQRGNKSVDAGLGFEFQRVLHLLEARREAGLLQVTVDIDQQLVLLAGQHGGRSFPLRAGRRVGTNRQLPMF